MAGDSEETADDELGRICRVSVVMLKIVRNRDIAFNALLSKVVKAWWRTRVGSVMKTTWLPAPKCLEANIWENVSSATKPERQA